MAAQKEKAFAAFAKKEWEEAHEQFNKAIEGASDDAELYAYRALTLCHKRMYDKALIDADKAIKLDEKQPRAYHAKGISLTWSLKLAEAKVCLEKAVSLDDKLDVKSDQEVLSKFTAEYKESEVEIKASKPEENPQRARFEALTNWLTASGGRFPLLFIKYYDHEYRGVHALTNIPDDTIILEIPLKLIMTSEVAKESVIGRRIISSSCRLRSSHSYLASYLLQEKRNPDSFWAPYLNILPADFNNVPIFFSPEEMKYLKGSFSLEKIADRTEDLLLEYENLCRCIPEYSKFSYKEFVWARVAVITRIFGLDINGLQTDGLVPMADMLNHKRPRETSWTFDNKRQSFTITSLQNLPRSAQVFDSYGPKCNSRFFVNYGFALEHNEENQAVIPASLSVTDPIYQTKLRYLGGFASSTRRRFQIPIQYAEKETKEAFAYARFVVCDDAELKKMGSPFSFRVDEVAPVAVENEIKAIRLLSSSAATELKNFDTTIEEDSKLLENKSLTFNIRNCIVMRRGEKRVLKYYADMAATVVPLLQMPWKQLEPAVAALSPSADYHDYITSVVVPLVRAAKPPADAVPASAAAAPQVPAPASAAAASTPAPK